MLIVSEEQRRRLGIRSLSKRYPYCSKALAAYPHVLSDDADLIAYHATWAAVLATEIPVDLSTSSLARLPHTIGFLCSAPLMVE